MYDERVLSSAARAGVQPISFEHPRYQDILRCFTGQHPRSVILTGTAGDGKTNLARKVWCFLQSNNSESFDEPYQTVSFTATDGKTRKIHVIKDLSEIAPQGFGRWDPEREQILQLFCRSIFERDSAELFLIAANDGQLIESWRKLEETVTVLRTRELLETLLVEDRQEDADVQLSLFNLSRGSSAEMFDLALAAFLAHEGWTACRALDVSEYSFFGPTCPIRHNFELLQGPLLQQRLRGLLELCDLNGLHIALRDILLLLSNAVLGHPGVKERLMTPKDVGEIIEDRTVSKASIYNNIFGGNLAESRRESLDLFDYLNRFRVGFETSNKIDDILIFGSADERLTPYFDEYVRADRFYGADETYFAAQREYIEGADEEGVATTSFLEMLVSQRRGLFFKISNNENEELTFWKLTVFNYAGEYLERVVRVLKNESKVERPILSRLVRGLNRVFTGMLVNSERELYLATSLSYSNAKVSRMLEEYISVPPRLGERVEIVGGHNGIPKISVELTPGIECDLQLNLTRFEFLSRVAEGALPSSFSKECYEDVLAFKTQILTKLDERRAQQNPEDGSTINFKLLELDDYGNPSIKSVEVVNA